MPGRELDSPEHAAAAIVAGLVSGRARPRDIDEADEGTHDFDIELSDRRRIALEVTAADDGEVRSLLDAAFGNEWPGPGLASDWWVVIGQVADGPQGPHHQPDEASRAGAANTRTERSPPQSTRGYCWRAGGRCSTCARTRSKR